MIAIRVWLRIFNLRELPGRKVSPGTSRFPKSMLESHNVTFLVGNVSALRSTVGRCPVIGLMWIVVELDFESQAPHLLPFLDTMHDLFSHLEINVKQRQQSRSGLARSICTCRKHLNCFPKWLEKSCPPFPLICYTHASFFLLHLTVSRRSIIWDETNWELSMKIEVWTWLWQRAFLLRIWGSPAVVYPWVISRTKASSPE